jgi:hypothetical protein
MEWDENSSPFTMATALTMVKGTNLAQIHFKALGGQQNPTPNHN